MAVLKVIGIILAVLLLIALVGPFLVPIPPLTDTLPAEQLADPDSRFIEVNGLTVHYKQAGTGRQAIILLHGFGASTFSWREVVGPLSQSAQVVAYDRPAFGLTERPRPGEWRGGAGESGRHNPYSPEAQVDLLFGLMDALKIDRAILVGNSAGGTVAINAALVQPERVQALVLVDAAVYGGGGSPAWLRPLFQTSQMDRLGVLLAREIPGAELAVFENCGHVPQEECPQPFLQVVEPFIQRAAAGKE